VRIARFRSRPAPVALQDDEADLGDVARPGRPDDAHDLLLGQPLLGHRGAAEPAVAGQQARLGPDQPGEGGGMDRPIGDDELQQQKKADRRGPFGQRDGFLQQDAGQDRA